MRFNNEGETYAYGVEYLMVYIFDDNKASGHMHFSIYLAIFNKGCVEYEFTVNT